MHETALFEKLLHQIQTLANEKGIKKIAKVNLKIGVLFPVSPENLRSHFQFALEDSPLKGTAFHISVIENISHPDSKNLVIESIEQE